MRTLHSLLHSIEVPFSDQSLLIDEIVFDSRVARNGSLFIALEGHSSDGHEYLPQVYSQGGRVALVQRKVSLPEDFIQLVVPDTRIALARLACEWYGNPSKELCLVGITGTNGKTTTATLLYSLFMQLGYHTGLLSTVVNRIGSEHIPSTHTTPNPLALNALLREMVDAGCAYCFMEVSSPATNRWLAI
jgi:UDP-N-acetylmuramoyl-L-alanyl-D-glutamate--2,6-diaminopimelate ligase